MLRQSQTGVCCGRLLPEALSDAIWNMVARFWHVAPQMHRQQWELERESAEVGPDGDLERDTHVRRLRRLKLFEELGRIS